MPHQRFRRHEQRQDNVPTRVRGGTCQSLAAAFKTSNDGSEVLPNGMI